jgi:RNA polymerase sigma factor (TIGR02999 family)
VRDHGDITRLLEEAASGDDYAFEAVVEKVYRDLEVMAGRQMRDRFGGLAGLTLEPAALVNETLLKILRSRQNFANRRHFFAFASRVMRRVLVDYHRSRDRSKRGGDRIRVTLTNLEALAEHDASTDALAFVDALDRLGGLDARKGEIVELRVFWGLEMAEIAEALEISLSTVEREWRFSRSWLAKELGLG